VKRRAFIAALGGAAAWPMVARAQEPGLVRRIGVLMGTPENDAEGASRVAAFRQGLRALNWTEGNNISLQIRWGAADAERIQAFATELVGLAPDCILGTNTPTMRALKLATETIPIVFAGLSDPIGDGMVASLSKPGGNITGFASFDSAMSGKWLQLLKEMSPGVVRVALIYNPDTAPSSIFLPAFDVSAASVGVTLNRTMVRDLAGIDEAIVGLGRETGGGIVVMPDVFTSRYRAQIIELVARQRLPAIYPLGFWATGGGLMSYGPDFNDMYMRSASYIDRILRGDKPADLPVQNPTQIDMIINLKTARAIGLTVPPSLLARAGEVIE
jgi:putative tryptophan/tyrosine transport system substrate-binding protein